MTFISENGSKLFFACMHGEVKSVFFCTQYANQGAEFLKGGLKSLKDLALSARENNGDEIRAALLEKIPLGTEVIAILEDIELQFDQLKPVFQILSDSSIPFVVLKYAEAVKVHSSEDDWKKVRRKKKEEWQKYHDQPIFSLSQQFV